MTGKRVLRTLVPPAVVFLLAAGVWYLVSMVILEKDERFLLPPPQEVVRVGFLDRTNLNELLVGLSLSAEVAALGLTIAVLIGVTGALIMSRAQWLESSLYPYAVLLQTIPIIAMVPVFGFWFGFGFGCRVLVVVLFCLFPIIANTLFGLKSVADHDRDLFALHRAGWLTRLVKLELPAAMPSIFTGLRISAGLAVIGAVVSDFFFKQGQPGIGQLIEVYRYRLQSEQMFAAVILSSLLGIVAFVAFSYAARRVTGRWHESGRGQRGWS